MSDIVTELATLCHVYPHWAGVYSRAIDEITSLRAALALKDQVQADAVPRQQDGLDLLTRGDHLKVNR